MLNHVYTGVLYLQFYLLFFFEAFDVLLQRFVFVRFSGFMMIIFGNESLLVIENFISESLSRTFTSKVKSISILSWEIPIYKLCTICVH